MATTTISGVLTHIDEKGNKVRLLPDTETDQSLVKPGKAADAETVGRYLRASITPQMFGAKGDGTTDDTLAFADALDYCLENSKALFVPAGTYLVSTIQNPYNISIFGVGSESVLLGKDTTHPIIYCPNDITGLRISNLKLSRVDTPTMDDEGDGIFCERGGMMFWIENLTIERQRHGIRILGTISGGWINNCYAESNIGCGFWVQGANMTLNSCYALRNGLHGYMFQDSGGCFLMKCEAFWNEHNGFCFNPGTCVSDVTMNSCVCSFNLGHGIHFANDAYNVIISDLFCEYSGYLYDGGPQNDCHGLIWDGKMTNIRINGNFIWNCGSGICVNGETNGMTVNANLVSNNNFKANYGSGIQFNNKSIKNVYIHDSIIGNDTDQNTSQQFGILNNGATFENINVSNCDLRKNLGGATFGDITAFYFTNVKGVTDCGAFKPAIVESGQWHTNTYGFPVIVYIYSSNIIYLQLDDVDLAIDTKTIVLKPNQTLIMSFSGSPSDVEWDWFPLT